MKCMKTKKGYCLMAVILMIFLVWFVSGLKIETVSQHNEKLSEESNERQSILAELLEDSTEDAVTGEPEAGTEANPGISGESTGNESTGSTETGAEQGTNSGACESTETQETATSVQNASSSQENSGTEVSTTKQQSTAKQEATTKQQSTAKQEATTKQQSTAKQETTTKQQSTTETQTTTRKQEDQYFLVSIRITCGNVIGNKELNTSATLPADGVILDTQTVVQKGETVLDALTAACADNGISFVNEGSSYGAYISAIGGLAEKECGRYSGWKYTVNGVVSSVSCSSCVLEENDEIVWYYATDYK